MWASAAVLGAVQAFFFALFFLKRAKRPGNVFLALFFLTAGATVAQDYMYGSGAILNWPHLSRLGFPITALGGVFYYLAVSTALQALDGKAPKAKRPFHRDRRMFLFVLPAAQIAYLLPYYFSSAADKLIYIREDLRQVHLDCEIMYWSSLLYMAGLAVLSFDLLRRKWKTARGKQRSYAGIWLSITGALLAFPLVGFGLYLVDPNVINRGIIGVFASAFMLVLAANRVYFKDEGLAAWQAPEPEYKKSLLSDAEVAALGKEAGRFLERDQNYSRADLRPADLARAIGVTPHTLSQVLSRNFNKSFHEFMNEHRVAEAARRLRDPAYGEYTILRIALDCGFNSKSTFNHAFRGITGQTPSEYRRKKGPTHLERSIRTS